MAKPRIAHISGSNATIANSAALVTATRRGRSRSAGDVPVYEITLHPARSVIGDKSKPIFGSAARSIWERTRGLEAEHGPVVAQVGVAGDLIATP